MNGLEQTPGERAGADVVVHFPDEPGTRELPYDERREKIRRESALVEAPYGSGCAHGRPKGEAHERHRGRQHPNDELGPIRDGFREADAKERRISAENGFEAFDVHSAFVSKSSRITSSSGGSSIVRSVTLSFASRWL